MTTLYIKALAILLVLMAAFGAGHHMAAKAAHAEMTAHLLADSRAQAQAEKAARDAEHRLAEANAAAAEQYEKGKRDAEIAGKRVADGLRAGTVRLRKRWQGCEAERVPGAAPGGPVADDPTEGRAGSAGRIIGAADDDAAKIRALQKLLESERK